MDEARKLVFEKQIVRVCNALEGKQMNGYFVASHDKLPSMLSILIPENSMVRTGGSVTLERAGVIKFLKNGKYDFATREESSDVSEFFYESMRSDVYLASANAITEDGEIFNVDGRGNRVAAITFGPKKVILIVGKNKIVKNVDEALKRIKKVAAPANNIRLKTGNPCTKNGACVDCSVPTRICSHYAIHSHQVIKNRIDVIIVGEDLGY